MKTIAELEQENVKLQAEKEALEERMKEAQLATYKEQRAAELANQAIEQSRQTRDTFEQGIKERAEEIVRNTLGSELASFLGSVIVTPKIELPGVPRQGNLSKADRQLLDIVLGRGQKAMTIATDADGGYLVPTELSAVLIEAVQLKCMIAPFFNQVEMPTETFKIPVNTADPDVEYLGEATSATAKKPTLSQLTLSAKKLISYVPWSYELDENTVIPLIPWLKESMGRAIANAEEKAIVFGDDTTTAANNIDKNVVAKHPQLAFNGLWYTVKNGTSTWFVAYATSWATSIRALRAAMDKYAADPTELLVICPVYVFDKLRQDTSNFTTWDKAGPNASVLTGLLPNPTQAVKYGFFDGIPVAATSWLYKTDANGVRLTTAGSNTKYNAMLVNHRRVWWGRMKSGLRIEMDRNIVDQVIMMVISERVALGLPDGGTTGAYAGSYNGS